MDLSSEPLNGRRIFAIGRIIGTLLTAIGIGLSVYCACEAWRMSAEFDESIVARPMEAAIDLSRPGETKASFHQTYSISHFENFFLQCELDKEALQNPQEFFKGLSGEVVIKNSSGETIETAELNEKTVQNWDDRIKLAGLSPFRKGDYTATIHIVSGVPALAGKQQTIYAQYELCGLEKLPAQIFYVFAFGSGFIGLISAVCVLPGLLQNGFWRKASKYFKER